MSISYNVVWSVVHVHVQFKFCLKFTLLLTTVQNESNQKVTKMTGKHTAAVECSNYVCLGVN